jgi:hypothetical protein
MKVPEALAALGKVYEERNALYGDNYKIHGIVMKGLFPNGLTLNSPADFNRYALLVMIVSKLSRYTNQFAFGGHADSLNDATVYTQMLQELDEIK